MASGKLIRLAFQRFSPRRFYGTAERTSNWRDLMKKELETGTSTTTEESGRVCIYKVPSNMFQVEPKAYRPNNISIGPYHHGAPRLKKFEVLKKKFYCRLFKPNGSNGTKLDEAFKFLEEQEVDARRCYMDDIKLSNDEFQQMMLVDASFIIQLFKDLSESDFGQVPSLSRWMIPTIRRELIMLENQLPFFVLEKLFELTNVAPSQPCKSLKALALRFFHPLLQEDSDNIPECEKSDAFKGHHFLDLLRSNITPKLEGEKSRKVQTHMIRSMTELIEAGVKVKADETRQLLDISFEKRWRFPIRVRELTIPPLYINDHRGTLLRNIVAFEKCHKKCCNPDVTTYLFFFNGLINSADDVALLHYKGVLHHSLGDDHAVSKLINNISKEMARDKNESYLYKVVNDANTYCRCLYARKRASLVHHYFTSWVVGISTIGAIIAFYFTFIQTVCSFTDALTAWKDNNFWSLLKDAILTPFRGTPNTKSGDENCKAQD